MPLPPGVRMSLEQKKEIVKKVDHLRKEGLVIEDACKQIGIHFATYYTYRKDLNGDYSKSIKQPTLSVPVVDLKFEIISRSDAMEMTQHLGHGRFMNISYPLVQQLKTLRKQEAIIFPAPDSEKERNALITACSSQIRKAGLPYAVRYAKPKKSIVVFYREPREDNP